MLSTTTFSFSLQPLLEPQPSIFGMERMPDELLLKIMEHACDELQIYESHSQIWGFHSSFTQGRDLEWALEGPGAAKETKVARILDTYETHEERLRRSMVTKTVSLFRKKKIIHPDVVYVIHRADTTVLLLRQ